MFYLLILTAALPSRLCFCPVLSYRTVNGATIVGMALCHNIRYSDVVGSVKGLVEDSHRFVGTAPASQP